MKKVNIIKTIVLVLVICCISLAIHIRYYRSSLYNPLDPESKTTAEIMAERWPHPEPNDPNFLAEFKEYMGYEWTTDL